MIALSLAASLVAACGDDSDADPVDDSTSGGADSTGMTSPTTLTTEATLADTSTADAESSSSAGTSDDGSTGATASLLDRVIAGMGGEAALLGLEAVQLEVTGSRWSADEGYTPRDNTVPASDYSATIQLDVANAAMRLDVARTLTFGGLGLPLTYTEIVAGQLGYVDGVDNLFGAPGGPMLSDRVAATVRQQRLFNPQLLVREAIDDPTMATELGAQDYDGRPHELLQLAGTVRPIVLWVDSETDLVSRLTTLENNPLRRDVEVDVAFSDWAPTDGGALFPASLVLAIDGDVIGTETRESTGTLAMFEPDAFDLPMPGEYVEADAARGERNAGFLNEFLSVGIPLVGEQTFVMPTAVAPGVWHLQGGTHHSIIVEQAAGLVLFETPLAESRCEAVLAWAADTFPDQPVTHAVVSHYHADHAACARTLVARGATLIVGEGSDVVWTDVLAAPSTVEPDELEANPVVDPPIEFVADDGSFTIDDATRPVTVYDLANDHAVDMVLPLVDGVAFVADLYNPGLPFQLFGPAGAQAVVDALEHHGILGEVETIAGAHGAGTSTLGELQATAEG